MSDLDDPKGHADLKAMAKAMRRPLDTLYALTTKNDPFMAEMPSRLDRALWFAKLYEELKIGVGLHVRRILYLLVSQPLPVLLHNGEPLENTLECANALGEAVRDARYLDLIPPDVIIDHRNPAPAINFTNDETAAEISVVAGNIETHNFGDSYEPPTIMLPTLALNEPTVAQRYHVEIWIEKSTMNEVLLPLGRAYGINVATFVGEVSFTACEDLVKRAIASGRPVRILHVTDFDPGGRSMPTAAARKIEFILRKSGLDLDISLEPVALTPEQCVEYKLARTPIKESEMRAARFEARFGTGATELDALEAVHPGVLRQILVEKIERYYDADLDDAVEAAVGDAEALIQQLASNVHDRHADEIDALEEQRSAIRLAFERVHGPAKAALDQAIKRARVEYEAALEAVRSEITHLEQGFVEQAEPVMAAMNAEIEAAASDADDLDWPEAAEADEEDDHPLYDSRRSYVEQVDRYRQHQGKDSDVSLCRDRVTFKPCDECGELFDTKGTNAKICGSLCANKRQYRVRIERKRQASKLVGGQKGDDPDEGANE
jgi:hypothetical protein